MIFLLFTNFPVSVGNHALEYGFPSTHSTNSVSMALYFGGLVWRHSSQPALVNGLVYALLAFFALTVTFGRLYTAMVRPFRSAPADCD